MQQSDVQALFLQFATPLAGFAVLGGRKESIEELARNLWMAMLAGETAEEELWRSLSQADGDVCETVKRCYIEEMKPVVNEAQLLALRQRYWQRDAKD